MTFSTFLLLMIVAFHLAYTTVSSQLPKVYVENPRNGSASTLPVMITVVSSEACHSEIYLDGISIRRGVHSRAENYSVSFVLKELSRDIHTISIDLIDRDGTFIDNAVDRHDFLVVDEETEMTFSYTNEDEQKYFNEIEPGEEYVPELSNEQRSKAEVKDGWLVVNEHIEFLKIEASDSCEDIGWATRKYPRRIFDAFQFFNELDILELRLQELDHVVHKFILVEATRTHSNQPKQLIFEKNKDRFSRFREKIIHIIVDDLPISSDPWVLENFQRNAIMRGLSEGHPNDLVIIADVDEIPSSYVLDALRSCDGASSPAWLYSRFFNFGFQWEFQGQWKHPQAVRLATLLGSYGRRVSPQQVRMGAMQAAHTKIESAGWHCSFFADAEGVMDKVRAFTHQELNRQEWLDSDAIRRAISQGEDYFNADMAGRRRSEPRHGGLWPNPSCHGLPAHALTDPRFAAFVPDCAAAHGDDVAPDALASPRDFAGSCEASMARRRAANDA